MTEIITKVGANICGMIFVEELDGLGSCEAPKGQDVTALLKF